MTCLPGGETALDNATFVTMVNCSVGGIAPQLRDNAARGVGSQRQGPVKTTAFCASHDRVREHTGGLTWADFRAREAVREREKQAAHIDSGLFRGTKPAPMATALEHLGGVEALVLGGCCELNSTAQALITEIGTQLGHLAAANLGDGLGECVALEIHQLRQQAAGGHQNLEQLSRPCKCPDSVRQPHPRHETPTHARSDKNSRGERTSSTTS